MTASKLIKPDVEYKDSFINALIEYHKEGNYRNLDISEIRHNFEYFVEERCKSRSHAYYDYPEWVELVPDTVLWLVKNEEYIGTIKIRHRLNWHLEKWGGHFSFIIRPDKREIGYGQKILRKAIPVFHALDLQRVLITIPPENEVARHIVQKLGAKFEDEQEGSDKFPPRVRYWWDV